MGAILHSKTCWYRRHTLNNDWITRELELILAFILVGIRSRKKEHESFDGIQTIRSTFSVRPLGMEEEGARLVSPIIVDYPTLTLLPIDL